MTRNICKCVALTLATMAIMTSLAFAQESEIVKVMGRGVGADKAEALKDAYRDAVERAVGLYVDAEQMMKNEELVKNQILTHSNAYIEKYDVVRENTKPNGLVEIQILAEVRKKALSRKISDVMPAITFALGGELRDVHAKITTIEKRNQDGAELLKEFLEGFNPLMKTLDLTLASPKMIIQKNDDGNTDCVTVNYFLKMEINQDRYFNDVLPKFREILRQVAVGDPVIEMIHCIPDRKINLERCVDNDIKQISKRPRYNLENQYDTGSVDLDLEAKKNSNKKSLYLIVGKNKYGTYKVEKYDFDEECHRVFLDWFGKMTIPPFRSQWRETPLFAISFLDRDNEVVCCKDVEPVCYRRNSNLQMNMCLEDQLSGSMFRRWAIGPWHWRDEHGLVTFGKYFWCQFQIPKDIMPEIANMKIEMK